MVYEAVTVWMLSCDTHVRDTEHWEDAAEKVRIRIASRDLLPALPVYTRGANPWYIPMNSLATASAVMD